MEIFDVTILQELHREMARIIDFGESAAAGRVVVNFHVHPDLDALKERSAGLPETLAWVASELSGLVGLSLDMYWGIAVGYYHTYGYLISVPFEFDRFFSQRQDFGHRFSADGAEYYSHGELEHLTATYGDVNGQIGGMLFPSIGPTQSAADRTDLEIEIIHELQVHILEHEDLLVASARVCAELDWYGRPTLQMSRQH